MRLPKIKYTSQMPKYVQTAFSGIDRSEYSSDGSINDMLNISTREYPLLATTPNRRQKEEQYELPWYYGKANKEFVIAGKIDGTDYYTWASGNAYSVGTVVAYGGKLYECISYISASAEYSAYAPPNYTAGWKEKTGNTFTYDGTWSASGVYTKGSVWYFNGKFYRKLTDINLNPSTDERWGKTTVANYRGAFDASGITYNYGDIVYYYNAFYSAKSSGSYLSSGTIPTNTNYWTKLSSPSVWSRGSTYTEGAVVYYNGVFYKALTYIGTAYPDEDPANWEHYNYAQLYYDGNAIAGLELIPGKKECAYLNGNIVILPDNMFYNVYTGNYGYLAGTKSGMFKTSDYVGFFYNNHSFNYNMVVILGNGKSYTGNDSDGVMNCLRLGYQGPNTVSTPVTSWVSVDLTKIFTAGDVITVNQTYQPASPTYQSNIRNGSYVATKVYADAIIFENNTFAAAVIGAESNEGSSATPWYNLGNMIFSKGLPEMDYLCVSNNRMWGCKDETVYACELGNCFSWQRYGGEENDPAYLESGDIGKFTGCCEYQGYPTFFKENEMYRVYGSTTTNFALSKVADYGIKEGCSQSVCTVDSILFFLSPSGVCAYTGGVPAVISDGLKCELSNAIAGTDGKRYFLSASEGDGRRLYVYDTDNRMWSSEEMDDIPLGIANSGTDLLYMNEDGIITTIAKPSGDFGNEVVTEKKAYIEFNDFYDSSIGTKDVGRVIIRASVDPQYNALDVLIQYDSDGMWHKVGSIYNQNTRKKVSEFGFFPRKCDHYRLKLECEGKFILYSIARQVKNNG